MPLPFQPLRATISPFFAASIASPNFILSTSILLSFWLSCSVLKPRAPGVSQRPQPLVPVLFRLVPGINRPVAEELSFLCSPFDRVGFFGLALLPGRIAPAAVTGQTATAPGADFVYSGDCFVVHGFSLGGVVLMTRQGRYWIPYPCKPSILCSDAS